MRSLYLLLLITILSGCVVQNTHSTNEFFLFLDNSVNDSSYVANSVAENENSGGRFVTSINFDVQNNVITTGTVIKYSASHGNESNITYTLEEYKKNNEFWRNEIHTQKEIFDKVRFMLSNKSFEINSIKCFRLQNNASIQTIRLDANVCFDNKSISVYSERSDYGRGGYYYWYEDGYDSVQAKLKQMEWD